MTDLHPETLTWTALLARWIEFAKAALALPDDEEGTRWRASVTPIIQLQAVTFALAELDDLPADERALGRDRAEILVRTSVRELEVSWRGVAMPESLLELCADARTALRAARYAGAIEYVVDGDEPVVVPQLDVPDGPATAAIMAPGTIAMPGEPIAWFAGGRPSGAFAAGLAGPVRVAGPPRQVYRQVEDGRIVRDVLRPVTADPVAGVPLLVVLREDGVSCGSFSRDAVEWEAQQRAAMTGDRIEVAGERGEPEVR